MYTFKKH